MKYLILTIILISSCKSEITFNNGMHDFKNDTTQDYINIYNEYWILMGVCLSELDLKYPDENIEYDTVLYDDYIKGINKNSN